LAQLTATPAPEFDVASRTLYRMAGVSGGMESPTVAAADRWAKSASRAAAKATRCLSVVRAVELRESGRLQRRPRYKVVG
jgi:hypothetical protein